MANISHINQTELQKSLIKAYFLKVTMFPTNHQELTLLNIGTSVTISKQASQKSVNRIFSFSEKIQPSRHLNPKL
jgi:hypothetical protein